jgi:hypothetical protein
MVRGRTADSLRSLYAIMKSPDPSSYSRWNEETQNFSSKTGSCADGFKPVAPCVSLATLTDGLQEVIFWVGEVEEDLADCHERPGGNSMTAERVYQIYAIV